ncbi:MAG: glycosyltransferase family 39 protein [Deltaproteobacteria bacterium]|nr:glycosyltransferase family 39 protein [Deltaproteobacteria bacterium]
MRFHSWRSHPRFIGGLVFLFCAVLYLWGIGTLPFYTKGEPREGTVVWEIYTSGEWILPLRNGQIIPSKPPLFHWLGTLVSFLCRGMSEFTIRFPSAALAIVGVLLTYRAGLVLWGVEAGLVAALVLATSFEWIRAATTARVDMTLTVCMVLAFLFFQSVHRRGAVSRRESLLLFLLLGFATLAKGPVGAVLPGLTVVVFLVLQKDLAFLTRFSLLSGGALFVVVAGAWYGLALWQGGYDFFTTQIMKENVLRFVSSNAAGAGHEHPFYYFVPNLMLGMAPWSFFFPAAAIFLYQRRATWREQQFSYPVVWAVTVFLFYSAASGKRTVYVLPMYPALALLLGAWWQELRRGAVQLPAALSWLLQGGGYVCFLTVVAAVLLVLGQIFHYDLLALIRPLLHPKDQSNLPVFANVVARHPFAFVLWFGVVGPAALLLLQSLRRQAWGQLFAALVAFTFSTFLLVNNVFQPLVAEMRTFKPFMMRVTQQVGGAPLFFYYAFDNGALYYAQRRIPHYDATLVQPGQVFFLLMWEDEWQKLAAQNVVNLQAVDTSEGTGPKGKRRLVLVAAADGAQLPAPVGRTNEAENEMAEEDAP